MGQLSPCFRFGALCLTVLLILFLDRLAKRAEVYDAILSAFLERMLARNDMQNTILIIRADHGLQSGPTMADYSMQIEGKPSKKKGDRRNNMLF